MNGSEKTLSDMSFGIALRRYRRAARLSMEELAAKADVSVRTVGNLERGASRDPQRHTVEAVVGALQLAAADQDRLFSLAFGRPPEPLEACPPPTADSSRVPRHLPLDVAGFAGRKAELARLDQAIRDLGDSPATVVLSAVAGMAGVGKTTLALHWAHQVSAQYPDGQLFVNLRGFDIAEAVVDPADVLSGFLSALGIQLRQIPAGLDERAALFRTLAADKRLLVVLDNARDEEQVRPLLPGAGGCTVVVTSRDRLTGLVAAEGARSVRLDVLSDDEAWSMLAGRIGRDRLAAEPTATADIVAATGRLPLALAIVGARIATHPGFPLAAFAAELRAPDGPLNAFDEGGLRRVFSRSYLACSESAARVFRLLGLHPGPDLTAGIAAALAGTTTASVRPTLGELTRIHLLVEHQPGRYLLHDLLREYASELARSTEDDEHLAAAWRRLFDRCLQDAYAVRKVLNPTSTLPMPEPLTEAAVPPESRSAGMAWFVAEEGTLTAVLRAAADRGADEFVWRLAWCLHLYYDRVGRWQDSAPIQRMGLAAAEHVGDQLGQATALRTLARAESRTGRLAEAGYKMRRARDLYTQLDDAVGGAAAEINLAEMAFMQGDPQGGIVHSRRAAELCRRIGDHVRAARAMNAEGFFAAHFGDYAAAVAVCTEALAAAEAVGDDEGQAATLDSLAFAHRGLGDLPRAVALWRRSARLYRRSTDRFNTAQVLIRLGDIQAELGDRAEARKAWREAFTILLENGDPAAERLQPLLDG